MSVCMEGTLCCLARLGPGLLHWYTRVCRGEGVGMTLDQPVDVGFSGSGSVIGRVEVGGSLDQHGAFLMWRHPSWICLQ